MKSVHVLASIGHRKLFTCGKLRNELNVVSQHNYFPIMAKRHNGLSLRRISAFRIRIGRNYPCDVWLGRNRLTPYYVSLAEKRLRSYNLLFCMTTSFDYARIIRMSNVDWSELTCHIVHEFLVRNNSRLMNLLGGKLPYRLS